MEGSEGLVGVRVEREVFRMETGAIFMAGKLLSIFKQIEDNRRDLSKLHDLKQHPCDGNNCGDLWGRYLG
ncbi:MAG: hypothetical protein ACYCZO_13340 [Daejeonella sp.]